MRSTDGRDSKRELNSRKTTDTLGSLVGNNCPDDTKKKVENEGKKTPTEQERTQVLLESTEVTEDMIIDHMEAKECAENNYDTVEREQSKMIDTVVEDIPLQQVVDGSASQSNESVAVWDYDEIDHRQQRAARRKSPSQTPLDESEDIIHGVNVYNMDGR